MKNHCQKTNTSFFDKKALAFLPNLYQVGILLLLGFMIPTAFPFSNHHSSIVLPDEICDNAIDDDGDGLIDLNDPDCDCEPVTVVSLIPNASFEENNCCPTDHSQMFCANTWIQASGPTTDYIHTCGWMGWEEFPPPQPFPDGNGAIGIRDGVVVEEGPPWINWKEYAGACLSTPLLKDSLYRFEFDLGFVNATNSPPIEITLFGTADCEYLPFGKNNIRLGCPTNDMTSDDWVKVTSTNVTAGSGGRGWVKSAFEFTPTEDLAAIVIGPACEPVVDQYPLYYYFDNLFLSEVVSFEFKVNQVGNPCSDDFTLEIPYNALLTYQWYKEGVALIGETNAQLSAIQGEGLYQVRMLNGMECKVVTYNYQIPVINQIIEQTICTGESFSFAGDFLTNSGDYSVVFPSEYGCDSVVVLQLNVIGLEATDTTYVHIFEGENYEVGGSSFSSPGEYVVNFESNFNCDSLVLLVLDYYHLYFPNAFSPNGDGVNDEFTILGSEQLVNLDNLKVFDRWGSLLYEGKEAWDGTRKGKISNPGIYVYLATVIMDDGQERQFSGSVLLYL